MSSADRVTLLEAQHKADDLAGLLEPFTERLVVAGSVRRRRPTIGDLELVAIPRTRPGPPVLFGSSPPDSELWLGLDRLVAEGVVARAPPVEITCPRCEGRGGYGDTRCERCHTRGTVDRAAPWGDRYRKLAYKGLLVDLFTATPASFGAILLIRTGPPAYSQAWVTALHAFNLAQRDGVVVDAAGAEVNVPDEAAAHALIRWRLVPPERRDDVIERPAWAEHVRLRDR